MRRRAAPIVLLVGYALFAAFARAADENASALVPPERAITADEREHWAYRPLAEVPVPIVDDSEWNAHPVDRFLKSRMESKGIAPLPRAGKATLLRRVTFDLTGLPPTPADVEAFLADESSDAYQRVVDRLLGSPAYGEHQAGHWLDLARFAESDGFEFDAERPNAWRYRDWVIDALNRDLPFDEFLRLQIAGDEMSDEPAAKVATGFLLCGPDMPDMNQQDERRHIVLNEMASTVGAVFLGMQVGCAQCHDHKYDPITQYDFYRLRAFFESVDIFHDHPIPTATEAQARSTAEASWTAEDHKNESRRRELFDAGLKRHRDKNPDEPPTDDQVLAELNDAERAEHAGLIEKLAGLPVLPAMPQGRVTRDGKDRECHLYLRGDFQRAGPVVSCGFPRLLSTAEDDPSPQSDKPRTALAAWLSSGEHPLTARVIVNRVWQWDFGAGLSVTPSDFGVMGTAPAQPELLDWLARRFVADGWSLKRLHRLLVTSRAYQSASAPFDHAWSADQLATAAGVSRAAQAADPYNALWWRARRQRLDAETLRDAMLSAGDRLSARRGGPGIRPPLAPEVTRTLLKDQWNVNGDDEDHRRRSIYLFVRRNLRYPLFDVFDRPDTNATCAARHESTTAPQSLALLNSEFSLESARAAAGVLLRGQQTTQQRIEAAYLRVFARRATDDEVHAAVEFLKRQAGMLRGEGRQADSLALPVKGAAESENAAAERANAGAPAAHGQQVVRATRAVAPRNADGATEKDAALDVYDEAALVDFCLALVNASEFLYVD